MRTQRGFNDLMQASYIHHYLIFLEYRLEEVDEGEPKLYEVFDKTISIIVKDKKTGKVIQEIFFKKSEII